MAKESHITYAVQFTNVYRSVQTNPKVCVRSERDSICVPDCFLTLEKLKCQDVQSLYIYLDRGTQMGLCLFLNRS